MKTIPNLTLSVFRRAKDRFFLRFQFQHREHCFIHHTKDNKLEREKKDGSSYQLEGREKVFTMKDSFLSAISKLEMDCLSKCIVDQYLYHLDKNKGIFNEHTPEFRRELHRYLEATINKKKDLKGAQRCFQIEDFAREKTIGDLLQIACKEKNEEIREAYKWIIRKKEMMTTNVKKD